MMKGKKYKLTKQELNHPSPQPSLRGLTLAFQMNQANYLIINNINQKMKPNQIFRILTITLIGLPALLKAQISESFTLPQNELIFQKNADFDELITKDYSFTDEIGNP